MSEQQEFRIRTATIEDCEQIATLIKVLVLKKFQLQDKLIIIDKHMFKNFQFSAIAL